MSDNIGEQGRKSDEKPAISRSASRSGTYAMFVGNRWNNVHLCFKGFAGPFKNE
jgi:hypothetical protein